MPYLELGRKSETFSESAPLGQSLVFEHKFPGLAEAPSPINDQKDDGAIVLSVDHFSGPPKTLADTDPSVLKSSSNEDVVMVVPTALNPNKEVTIGIIFLVVSLVFLLIFAFFVYVGYVQYKALLSTKGNDLMDLEGSAETIVVEKPRMNGKIDYKNLNFSTNSKEHQFRESGGSKASEPKPSLMSKSVIVGKLPEPQGSHLKQTYFKPPKLTSRLNKIGEYSEDSLLNDLREKHEIDTSMGHDTPYSFGTPKQRKAFKPPFGNGNKSENSMEKRIERKSERRPDRAPKMALEKKAEKKILSSHVSQMLNKYRKESQGLGAFINDVEKADPGSTFHRERIEKHKPNPQKKITYSIKELVKLEPVDVYQMFEYSYDDGDLLVTDLIFPSIPVLKNNLSMNEIEKILTEIRIGLLSRKTDSVTKVIELFIFITFSFGIKTYANPKVFTLPYGILVDTMIQFDLVSQIPEQLSLVMQSGFVETIILYCINCWKFDKINDGRIQQFFEVWNTKPYIPTKLKLYKFIVTLLLQGYRSSLLKEVLIFFSIPPSPHLLQNIITEALKNETPPDIHDLLQYLRRQLQEEHYNCCSNTEKWRHWEFTTAGMKNSPSVNEQFESSMYKIPGNKYESLTNVNFSNEENIKRQPQKTRNALSDNKCIEALNNANSFQVSKENKLFIGENISKLSLQPESIKMYSSSGELPGSLIASPIHSSPKNL
ncbi:hypothetical protein PICMEDRAFT_9681 [Pichia membranifaciens NRRL Y-2026]|uniref:Uncharacterized protein n=1 Tax=Pichia membranifaciens NRRL Y-2026 TaxID=763406 RepID=A0A1E3NSX2_9ASCO|nr:hypothetical protein PICMEDRAFT_9681 [Pichia membranifaciens NRRL Y-2026]ODQ49201.1 hypothetical protein PICMEDRAFT_9681 [Pichia membranifaciens NRRL Y-2026]